MPIQTNPTPLDVIRSADKKLYQRPTLVAYGDINAVTRDLDSSDLLSVTVVAVV